MMWPKQIFITGEWKATFYIALMGAVMGVLAVTIVLVLAGVLSVVACR